MENIAIARRMRGMSAKALADELGVAYQQVGNWEQGIRNPSRASAEQIAEVLNVDVAWIMGCPQDATIYDPIVGVYLKCKIVRSEQIDGYGMLYHLYIDDTGDIVAQIRSNDVTFTTCDWQSVQPYDVTEIAEYRWMDWRGFDAIMLDGLPRVLA